MTIPRMPIRSTRKPTAAWTRSDGSATSACCAFPISHGGGRRRWHPHRSPDGSVAPSSSEAVLNSRQSQRPPRVRPARGLMRRMRRNLRSWSPGNSASSTSRGCATDSWHFSTSQLNYPSRRYRAGVPISAAITPRRITHGWGSAPVTPGPDTVFVPPSAFAAGIIASREIRLGIHRGPANELAVGAVVSSAPVNDALAADLIKLSVNVFQPERDGFRLQSARTLSTGPAASSVERAAPDDDARLTLQRIGDRLVFEPGTPQMRSVLAQTLGAILGDFHRRGAFAGATEADSFFVRCDDRLNTPQTIALGQLIAEVGVAPAEPLEFIVVRIVQTAEGTEVSLGG